jgi:hypothetical protein
MGAFLGGLSGAPLGAVLAAWAARRQRRRGRGFVAASAIASTVVAAGWVLLLLVAGPGEPSARWAVRNLVLPCLLLPAAAAGGAVLARRLLPFSPDARELE